MSEKITLQGEEAMELWRQGKDAWNNWVKQNPEADVSFKRTDFSIEPRTIVNEEVGLHFKGFCFPNGLINFSFVNFGDGYINFSDTQFGEGYVDFSKSNFGEGYVDFSNSNFKEGNVAFTRTQFIKGHVDFSFAQFGKGIIDFRAVDFGEGDVDFRCVKFSTIVTFAGARFDKHANFISLDISEQIENICFRYAIFNGSFEFSTQSEINIIPDFVGTKTTNHTSLSGMRCKPKIGNKHLFIFSKAADKNDAEKLCRLKEIAESNKDHVTALRFHADEMRAKRWQKERIGTTASLLDWLFDVFSLYGQSIWRPMAGLLLTITTSLLYTVGFCFPLLSPSSYAQWFTNMGNISYQTWVYGFDITLSRTIPFLGGIRVDGAFALKELEPLLSVNFSLFSALFSLLAFAFIFLIGLGLRNRFRL